MKQIEEGILFVNVENLDACTSEISDLDNFLSDQKLKELTQSDDLHTVSNLEVIVDTSQISMGNLGDRLPNLRQLKLNNSKVPCIRDLGTSVRNVVILWLNRSEVKDLQGIGAFEKLRELYVAYNDITDLSPLGGLEMLEVLDLEGNNIGDMDQLCFLASCSALTSLSLDSNPISSQPGYRSTVFSTLPQLQLLDDLPSTAPEKVLGEQIGGVDCAEDERDLVTKAIKYARDGFDDVCFALLSGTEYDRPWSAGGSDVPRTPGSAAPASARPSSSGIRPATAFRPASARGSRDTKTRLNLPVHFSQSEGAGDDGSSGLTFGTDNVLCGHAGSSLRARIRSSPSEISMDEDIPEIALPEERVHLLRRASSSASEEASFSRPGNLESAELLSHLRAWKIETANIALMQDPEIELIDASLASSHTPQHQEPNRHPTDGSSSSTRPARPPMPSPPPNPRGAQAAPEAPDMVSPRSARLQRESSRGSRGRDRWGDGWTSVTSPTSSQPSPAASAADLDWSRDAQPTSWRQNGVEGGRGEGGSFKERHMQNDGVSASASLRRQHRGMAAQDRDREGDRPGKGSKLDNQYASHAEPHDRPNDAHEYDQDMEVNSVTHRRRSDGVQVARSTSKRREVGGLPGDGTPLVRDTPLDVSIALDMPEYGTASWSAPHASAPSRPPDVPARPSAPVPGRRPAGSSTTKKEKLGRNEPASLNGAVLA